jgi:hypothetical protein
MLFVGCQFLTGYWATATVTGGAGDGFCDVVWVDPAGQRHSGESDCYDEPAGNRFEVRVAGWPDAGEPALADTYAGMALLFGLPPFALGAGRLLQLTRRLRLPPLPHLATRMAPEGDAGALADPRTVAALGRVRRRAWLVAGLGTVGACVVLVIGAQEIEADENLRAVGVTTVGTVVQVDPDSWWSAGAASVSFTAHDVTQARDVTLGDYADAYAEGDVVDVVYDPSDPDRFTIDDALYGFDWTGWVLAPSLLLALVAPFGALRVMRARHMRRLLATRTWAPVRAEVIDSVYRWEFTTADGSVWRSGRYLGWLPDWNPHATSDHHLPDAGPLEAWIDQPAWWVSDGTSAVFAPDPGGPLVLARRR